MSSGDCYFNHHLACYLNRMTATVFVQPLDLVKNRMQLSGKCIIIIYCIWVWNYLEYGSGIIWNMGLR